MKSTALLLLIPLLAGCGKQPAPPPPQPQAVTVAAPERREVTIYREFPATLVGNRTVEIRARVRGVLSVDPQAPDYDGRIVEKGAPLFVIEPEPYLQSVRADEAAVGRTTAARDLADKRYQRVNRAGQTRAVSELEVEIAAAELAETEAAVNQAKAKLEESRITAGYTRIAAPFSGRMSRLEVDPGNLVGATESTLLATIIDESPMYAEFEVPERSLLRFLEQRSQGAEAPQDSGAKLRLKLADGSIHGSPGEIIYLDNQVDPSTRTAKVRASFPNPDAALAAGLYGLVGYPTGPDPADPTVSEALLVPSASVLRDLGGSFVWIIDDQNVVRRRAVEPGAAIEAPTVDPNAPRRMQTVILKGLEGSEQVIVSGLQRAREGATVDPQPEN